MEYYSNAIVMWVTKYAVELLLITVGGFFLAVMDHFRDRVPEDSGFWSHKTGPDKWDIWHLSKRLALCCFAVAALGFTDIIHLLWNTYIWAIVLLWAVQKIWYNGILKWLHKWFN